MKIVQVVGYKNSGKTTLTAKLIEILSDKGLSVASLKHHGHGGLPVGFHETDSEKHRKAGAVLSGAQGEGLFQLSLENTWDMEKMIAIYKLFPIDVLVIEGFKKDSFAKIVLINQKEDVSLLEQVNNVKVIVTTIPMEELPITSIPIFKRTDLEKCCLWVYEQLVNKETV